MSAWNQIGERRVLQWVADDLRFPVTYLFEPVVRIALVPFTGLYPAAQASSPGCDDSGRALARGEGRAHPFPNSAIHLNSRSDIGFQQRRTPSHSLLVKCYRSFVKSNLDKRALYNNDHFRGPDELGGIISSQYLVFIPY